METPRVCLIELTDDEVNFLLWALGRLYGEIDSMDEAKREWIKRHHDEILPKLIDV